MTVLIRRAGQIEARRCEKPPHQEPRALAPVITTDTTVADARVLLLSAAIYRRFGLRRSRFLLMRQSTTTNRHDERKVATRPTKAAINRRTPEIWGRSILPDRYNMRFYLPET